MESLAALLEQRAFCCRLSPDRALGSIAEAEAFSRSLLVTAGDGYHGEAPA